MTEGTRGERPFRIVSDSGCNLPPWLIKRFDISVIPTSYYSRTVPRTELLEDASIGPDSESLYTRMRNGARFGVDSLDASSCTRFLADLIEKSDEDILFIFSSKGIGTNDKSIHNYFGELNIQASNQDVDRSFVAVDSRSAGFGLGLLLMEACEMREAGASINDVAQWVVDNRLYVCHWFVTTAAVGYPSSAKPWLMHLSTTGKLMVAKEQVQLDSHIEENSKRSPFSLGLDALLDAFRHRADKPYHASSVAIVHADNKEAAIKLANLLDEHCGVTKPIIYDMEVNLGSRLGPGSVGIIFWGGPR